MKKENLYNIPNFLTLLRVFLTVLIIFFILVNYSLIWVIVFFVIAMITDSLDGFVARRFNQKTEFGRKFDMIADRFLFLGVLITFLIKFWINGALTEYHILQMVLISLREIISIPFMILILYKKKELVPHTNGVGKSVTVMQAISFPIFLLYILYPSIFGFSIYTASLTALMGVFSSIRFIKYSLN